MIWDDSVDAEFRQIGEIYSLWNSRHLVQPDDEPQRFEVGPQNRWSFQYAWLQGRRIGVVGASDNHLGQPGVNNHSISIRHSGGLAVALASTNTREAVWKALTERTTYATPGTPIYVDFQADGHPMGSEYTTNTPPRFEARIGGTNQIAEVEIVRLQHGMYETVYRARPGTETHVFEFTDSDFAESAMYYLRVTQADEYPNRLYATSTAEMAWSSPIWIARQ